MLAANFSITFYSHYTTQIYTVIMLLFVVVLPRHWFWLNRDETHIFYSHHDLGNVLFTKLACFLSPQHGIIGKPCNFTCSTFLPNISAFLLKLPKTSQALTFTRHFSVSKVRQKKMLSLQVYINKSRGCTFRIHPIKPNN